MRIVSSFSGGIGSWAASKVAVEKYGVDGLTLLFADTLVEHDDLYRFLIEAASNVIGLSVPAKLVEMTRRIPRLDIPNKNLPRRKQHLAELRERVNEYFQGKFVWLAEGRTPWEVFRDVKFVGNSLVDPCSKILKRKLIDRWCNENCPKPTTCRVVGLGQWERERFEGCWESAIVEGVKTKRWRKGLQERMRAKGWEFIAPLISDRPNWNRHDLKAFAMREGLDISDSYDDGFNNDNCAGACCKAGQRQWHKIYRLRSYLFQYAKAREEELREQLGDVAMMKEQKDGKSIPLPLVEFERRVKGEDDDCLINFGDHSCNCFVGNGDED